MAVNNDDAEYVDQVMASQSILNVKSDDRSSESRKRRLSSDDESENVLPAKKEKSDSDFADLLRAGLSQLQHDLSKTLDQKFDSFENKLKTAILATVQEEINGVRKEFNDRIDGLSKKLEEKMCSKLQEKIDSKLNDAKQEIKRDPNLNKLKDDVSKLQKSYADVASSLPHEQHSDRIPELSRVKVVIRNLKFDEQEARDPNITVNLVNSLIRDGLKLTNVKVVQAERKTSRNDKPGVIIAQFESFAQKKKVLDVKKSLKKIPKYQNVYIEDERSQEQRLAESNLRTVLQAVGKSKDYVLINGRFVKRSVPAKMPSTQGASSSK